MLVCLEGIEVRIDESGEPHIFAISLLSFSSLLLLVVSLALLLVVVR